MLTPISPVSEREQQELRELLSPLFSEEDATIAMVYPKGVLRLYPASNQLSIMVGSYGLSESVWKVVSRSRGSFAWGGRRLLPLIRKTGETFEIVSRLAWQTPYSLSNSFGQRPGQGQS